MLAATKLSGVQWDNVCFVDEFATVYGAIGTKEQLECFIREHYLGSVTEDYDEEMEEWLASAIPVE